MQPIHQVVRILAVLRVELENETPLSLVQLEMRLDAILVSKRFLDVSHLEERCWEVFPRFADHLIVASCQQVALVHQLVMQVILLNLTWNHLKGAWAAEGRYELLGI